MFSEPISCLCHPAFESAPGKASNYKPVPEGNAFTIHPEGDLWTFRNDIRT